MDITDTKILMKPADSVMGWRLGPGQVGGLQSPRPAMPRIMS